MWVAPPPDSGRLRSMVNTREEGTEVKSYRRSGGYVDELAACSARGHDFSYWFPPSRPPSFLLSIPLEASESLKVRRFRWERGWRKIIQLSGVVSKLTAR